MDSVRWKEFRILDIFEIKKVYGKPFKEYKKGDTPYVTGTIQENGVVGYVDAPIEAISKGNCISVDPITGKACYQPVDFVGRGFSGASINLLCHEKLNDCNALYVCSVIKKVSFGVASYTNLLNGVRLGSVKISLPAKEDGTPDWDYMAERIKELEAYLIASGLDDYELTEEDKQVLAKQVEWKEFKADELFRVISAHRVLSKLQLSNDGLYPAYSSDTKNNGIIGYCKEPEFIIDKTHPCYVVFGDHTRTMNIVNESFSVLDNVKVLVPPITNDKVLLFLITVWKKCIPNKGYARHWTEAKKCILRLPVRKDNQPDLDYMERYIRAIEKQVIANAVKWKDQQIATTKQIVDKSIA